jgi:antitoxin component YwqK of YwqJK toxin-antitoxin module
MKKVIAIFFVTALSLLGEEPKVVSFDKLQKRGEDGNQLYYLPDHKVPFTGKEVSYWPDGQKKTEISYKDGKRHGLKAHWYQSGQKLSEINYKYGKHDGLLTVWYENGQWRRTGNHLDGKMVGIWTHWYENGQQRDEIFYMGGYMNSAIVWKPNGEQCSMTDVKAGNGMVVKYKDDGTDWLRISFKEGEMTHWRRP